MISYVVPTVGDSGSLVSCLEAIRKSFDPDADEIVVVHQGGPLDRITALAQGPVQVLESPEAGLCKARNLGARHAKHPIVAFIDDDILVQADHRASISASFAAGDCGLLFGRIMTAGRSAVPYVKVHDSRPAAIDHSISKLKKCLGGNIAVRAEVFWNSGGFDPCFGVGAPFGGAEDIDLALRVLHHGGSVRYAPTVMAFHAPETGADLSQYLSKMYRYGTGEGAAYAKHCLSFGCRRILPAYLSELIKPAARLLLSLAGFNCRGVKISCSILKGRIDGFLCYRREWRGRVSSHAGLSEGPAR